MSDAVTNNTQSSSRVAVVGIGASAGGVSALGTLLESLPPEPGAAFVIIVHLSPDAPSDLSRILSAHTAMPVQQVGAPMPLRNNQVYVIPPDRQLEITDNEIAAVPFKEPRGRRVPIDNFFRSLANQHGDGFA